MDRQIVSVITSAFDAAAIGIPDAVTEAEVFVAVTAALAAKLRAEPAIDLEQATAATAAKMIEAAASHEMLHPVKLAKANQLASIAEQRALQAWQQAAHAARAELSAAFNQAAAALATAIATSDRPIALEHVSILPTIDPETWQPIGALCSRLDALAAMRDRFALWVNALDRAQAHSDGFERLSRHLHVLDLSAINNPGKHLRPGDSGPAHWVAAVASDVVEIRWQELPDQVANANALLRH